MLLNQSSSGPTRTTSPYFWCSVHANSNMPPFRARYACHILEIAASFGPGTRASGWKKSLYKAIDTMLSSSKQMPEPRTQAAFHINPDPISIRKTSSWPLVEPKDKAILIEAIHGFIFLGSQHPA